MGFVDKAEKVSLGPGSNVTVELEHKHQVILLLSDEHGYYVKELPEGTYCLKAARDTKGNPLHFSPRQHNCFKIKSQNDTRFDVMLLKSEPRDGLPADDKGKLYAKSDVVINSNLSGSALDAAVGHEGSHLADAQDVVSTIVITDLEKGTYKVGQDITRYQSEQRAYRVTDSILRAGNKSYHFGCGVLRDCILGTELKMRAQVPETIERLLANSPLYRDNGKPLSPKNQGGSVVNGLVVPH
jgi:hypothetical protein